LTAVAGQAAEAAEAAADNWRCNILGYR